jgi:uncharacterized damage-inducible protein DinB
MRAVLEAQYEMVRSARQVLLNYCDTVTPAHFTEENSGFGRGGSMRNLLVHNATTYQYWLGQHALAREMVYPEYKSIPTVQECRRFFDTIDELVAEFLAHFAAYYTAPITSMKEGKARVATPLEVFTHVTTHEFHHKGQILSISRHLGYIPVDTDVIRGD